MFQIPSPHPPGKRERRGDRFCVNLYTISKFGVIFHKLMNSGPVIQNWNMKPKKKVPPATPVPTSKVYRAHRERQRRQILDAAQELFNERGIDRVTIAEIVGATGIRPTTLY